MSGKLPTELILHLPFFFLKFATIQLSTNSKLPGGKVFYCFDPSSNGIDVICYMISIAIAIAPSITFFILFCHQLFLVL